MIKIFFKCIVYLTLICLGFSCQQSNLNSVNLSIDNDKQSRNLCSQNSIDCPIQDKDLTNTDLLKVLPNGAYVALLQGTMYNRISISTLYERGRLCTKVVVYPDRNLHSSGRPVNKDLIDKVYVTVSNISQIGEKLYSGSGDKLEIVDFHIKRPKFIRDSVPAFKINRAIWTYSGYSDLSEKDTDLMDCISSEDNTYSKYIEYKYDGK